MDTRHQLIKVTSIKIFFSSDQTRRNKFNRNGLLVIRDIPPVPTVTINYVLCLRYSLINPSTVYVSV